jgi:hypothetical protein
MDKKTVVLIQKELGHFASEIAKKYGLTLKRNNATYDDTDVSFKLSFAGTNKSGEDRLMVDWNQYYSLYGLKKEWLNKTYRNFSGELMRIRGLDSRKRKYPVIVENMNGVRYKVEADRVKMLMGQQG